LEEAKKVQGMKFVLYKKKEKENPQEEYFAKDYMPLRRFKRKKNYYNNF